jgi:xanthine dehydrogenase large subunit
VPERFNVRILEGVPVRASVYGSKGIGEPPIHLATAAWTALKDAIGSIADHRVPVSLDAPATPERILMAVERLRAGIQA